MIESIKVVIVATQEDAESLIILYPGNQGEDKESSLSTFRRHFEETKKGNHVVYLPKTMRNLL